MNNLLKEKSKFTYSLKVKTAQIHQDLHVKMPFSQKVAILTKIRPKIRLFWKKSLISDHGLLKRTIVGTLLICMPQELRSANHDLEIVNSSIYISPYWSPHHPQKSHWQESGLEMEHYLRIYCFHRSSLPLDGVTMNVSWRNRIGTYFHYLCSIALTSSSSLEAEYRIRSERN